MTRLNIPAFNSIREREDSHRIATVMEHTTDDNYYRLLEILYINYVGSGKLRVDELAFYILDTRPRKFKYFVQFITRLPDTNAEQQLGYYLDKFSTILDKPVITGGIDIKVYNFYEAFLEAGVTLDYFRQIEDTNETIPIWLSEQQEDV